METNKTNLKIIKALKAGLNPEQIARRLGRPLTNELLERIKSLE